ncbi:hydantoinase/oxoprolinase N-terminal domain-containing protein [Streptomyces sp. Rer75]|uniref:hydantoinase/oxoprolinase N-terminal domain-containing protein n=1 Tax=unclassified Streptomyces TaxID=2593676 RepID=UPI0015CFD942|nr:hydantoinase/oxoprolinase N-terminal domain-containing protein [Streptomyces sp. Rer75]QLH20420.1 hypothetical protein HYQ63_06985 [Streptomyces sp. Rer75]
MPSYYVASDIGGTFTDTVVIDGNGRVGRYKSSTVPDNPAEGVLGTLVDAAEERGVDLAELLADVETPTAPPSPPTPCSKAAPRRSA